jgi:uncharacterized protein
MTQTQQETLSRTTAHPIVDAWVNLPVPEEKMLVKGWSPDTQRWFARQQNLMHRGSTLPEVVAEMDRLGIESAMLSGRHGWLHPSTRPVGPFATSHGVDDEIFDTFGDELAQALAEYPGRFHGMIIIDPMGAMTAVRQVERAVKDYGCIAIQLFPAATGVPPDHPLCYPLYAKCVELGVPITVNLGVPGPRRSSAWQRPMLLEDVLLSFPELTVVGTHIGHPWHLETVALLQKHPNFYLMTSGWAPKYVPAEIWHHLNTRGKHQVMWASDYPMLPLERMVLEAEQLPLKDEVMPRYLKDNCIEVFKLNT